jgi:hypothetical protein
MKFRPEHDPRSAPVKEAEHDDSPGGPVEWEDNRLSNTLAWASYRFAPDWCQTPEHFTSRLTQHLFTDCPCCLLFRGVAIGVLLGSSVATLLAVSALLLAAAF